MKSVNHVAIGTDLDGGFGRQLAPVDMNAINDLQVFLKVMSEKGYTDEDVAKIAHNNLLQLFRNAWSK